MKIAIATDHNGVSEKEKLKSILQQDYEIIDLSPNNDPLDDFPIYAFKVAEFVKNNTNSMGILLCGTGIGMSIAANKVKSIRCAHVSNVEEAKKAREHNDANIIAMSAKYDFNLISECIKVFLTTEFLNEERLVRRNKLIEEYEREHGNEC